MVSTGLFQTCAVSSLRCETFWVCAAIRGASCSSLRNAFRDRRSNHHDEHGQKQVRQKCDDTSQKRADGIGWKNSKGQLQNKKENRIEGNFPQDIARIIGRFSQNSFNSPAFQSSVKSGPLQKPIEQFSQEPREEKSREDNENEHEQLRQKSKNSRPSLVGAAEKGTQVSIIICSCKRPGLSSLGADGSGSTRRLAVLRPRKSQSRPVSFPPKRTHLLSASA